MKADRVKVHVTLTREIRAALTAVTELYGTTVSAEVGARLRKSLEAEFTHLLVAGRRIPLELQIPIVDDEHSTRGNDHAPRK